AAAWWLGREDRIEVDTARVERGRVEETVTNSRAGTVEARLRAQLSPDSGGRVVALPHREGERVRAGEILLELESTLERGQVELSRRQVAAAAADRDRACLAAERAVRERDRTQRLAEERLVAEDALDRVATAAEEAAAACVAARAQEQAAGAALEVAVETLSKRTLRAPFDAIVAEVSTEVGEWITPSPPGVPIPPILDVLDPGSIYLSLPMDEVDAGRLRVGLPARATVDSLPGRTFAGTVSRVAPYVLDVQAQNRTVEIEVELEDATLAEKLLPGTSADVEVILEERDDVLRVPTAAILADDRVLVVEQERLAERPIETGLRNWDFTEVRSGLEAGDRVVTTLDRPEVRAGARVASARDDEQPAGR
ncbi:MAG TPA: efflux RND transporter periplasmic adaptor subunit, partial [Thermoanaerobaculia bacterium]|nr:efflux RND transporter periplasmic adaptor subunit [Thermoanaerobaculia bacterium]